MTIEQLGNPQDARATATGKGGVAAAPASMLPPRRPAAEPLTTRQRLTPIVVLALLVSSVAMAIHFGGAEAEAAAGTTANTRNSAAATARGRATASPRVNASAAASTADADRLKKMLLTYPNAKQVPLNALHGNPFSSRDMLMAAAIAPPGGGEDFAKQNREDERQSLIRSAQGLKLQSIMAGMTRSACMINSTIYREGQSIDAFVIEKILPSSVIVRSGSFRFELRTLK